MLNYLFLLSFLIYLLIKECKKDSKVYIDCNADILVRNAQIVRENREILKLNKEIRALIKK